MQASNPFYNMPLPALPALPKQTLLNSSQGVVGGLPQETTLSVQNLPKRELLQEPFLQASEVAALQAQPAVSQALAQALSANLAVSGETLEQRLGLWLRVSQGLSSQGVKDLQKSLQRGALSDVSGKGDAHSALYHLYSMRFTPRSSGLNPQQCLEDTLAILAHPDNPKQDFVPLEPALLKAQQQVLKQQTLDAHQTEKPLNDIANDAMQLMESNNCAAASQMSRLASKNPKELARLLSQASSATGVMLTTASPWQLAPEAPDLAEEVLKQSKLTFSKQPNGQFLIELPVPRLAMARVLQAQRYPALPKENNGETPIELASQAIQQASSIPPQQKPVLINLLQNSGQLIESRALMLQLLKQIPSLSTPDAMAIMNSLLYAANSMETLFQSSMLYNFTRKTYDPSTDARDTLDQAAVSINMARSLSDADKEGLLKIITEAPSWTEARDGLFKAVKKLETISPVDTVNIINGSRVESFGLTEQEKNMMERVMEPGEPYTSVLYQIEGGPSQPNDYNQDKVFVYGYSRTFGQMQQDLLKALESGHEVILGMAYTGEDGQSLGGHEVKVKDAFSDPTTGELSFHIADSDDDDPKLQVMTAAKLLPQIHHMGLPYSQAKPIWDEFKANPTRFYTPDESDAQSFELVGTCQQPAPETTLLPGMQAIEEETSIKALRAQLQANSMSPTVAPPRLQLSA